MAVLIRELTYTFQQKQEGDQDAEHPHKVGRRIEAVVTTVSSVVSVWWALTIVRFMVMYPFLAAGAEIMI